MYAQSTPRLAVADGQTGILVQLGFRYDLRLPAITDKTQRECFVSIGLGLDASRHRRVLLSIHGRTRSVPIASHRLAHHFALTQKGDL
ncbi:hypothetical protein [Paraburkholderia sp. SG-MS1]|uniref:hypothetical protein n=1 Tax=Paraburkholderia sp. SG-MS1 TaxID=2023741 RepID=UPI001EEB7EFD|nr:hypothetical protein [Paraburkholderia sp. SG-MS1]